MEDKMPSRLKTVLGGELLMKFRTSPGWGYKSQSCHFEHDYLEDDFRWRLSLRLGKQEVQVCVHTQTHSHHVHIVFL